MDFRREVNSILVKKTRYSVVGQTFLTTVALFYGSHEEKLGPTLFFVTVLYILNGFRFLCLFMYSRMQRKKAFEWAYVYSALTLSTGVTWGCLTSWSFLTFGLSDHFFVLNLVMMAGLASGGTAVLTPAKGLARTFVCLLVVPVAFSMIFLARDPEYVMALILLSFVVFLLSQIRMQTDLVWELRDKRNKMQAFEQVALEALVMHENGIIIDVNNSMERMFGFSKAELIGKNLRSVVDSLELESHGSDEGIPSEAKCFRKNGENFTAEFISRQIIYEGHRVQVTCLQDVTFRKQAEEMMKTREREARESAEIKSQFLANMSHEIRTPMNAIIGLTDLLSDTPLSDLQRKYFRTLKDSGESLLNLVNDILDFSKIDANKLDLEEVPFSLAAAIEGQVGLLASKAHEKQIQLHCLIDPSFPSSVLGDYGRFGQIILNLVSNAIKFTQAGSVIVKGQLVSQTSEKARLRVEVCDTGIGISDEQQTKLFKPFTQADNTMARRFGGTGLGLSICEKLVVLMGGQIGLVSQPGEGTTFWFELEFPIVTAQKMSEAFLIKDWSDCKILISCRDEGQNNDLNEVVKCYLDSWSIPYTESLKSVDGSREKFDLAIVTKNSFEQLIQSSENILTGKNVILVDQSLTPAQICPTKMTYLGQGSISFIHTPMRYSELFNAITEALKIETGSSLVLNKTEDAPMFNGLRVLVAEDNTTNQLIILALLKKMGLSCHAVGNGTEVIEAYATGAYDLILMDCQMPELDGYQATKRIRAIESYKDKKIPIVALTANVLKEDRDRCLDAGMNDFLSKPIRRQRLTEVLSKYLGAA